MNDIKSLCKMYTHLDDSDINIIENISEMLQFIADLVKADVFIDCPSGDKAIVVAEAKPSYCKSIYKNSVVGEFAIIDDEPAVIRTLQVGMPTKDLKGVTQEKIQVKQTVEPIKNKSGKTIGVLIIEKDETEIVENNRRIEILSETNEKLTNILAEKRSFSLKRDSNNDKNITYHIDDSVIIFDENGVVRFKNPVASALYKNLGYKEDLLGMDFSNVSLNKYSFDEIINDKKADSFEVEINNMVLQVKYIVQTSKVLNLVMVVKDITDVKQKEKELILKSVVIKEIHHRVKNNLQTIASLLRLQLRRIDNEEFKSALTESMNRILSIATTHEILAQQGIDELNIKEVIQKLKVNMVRCYNIEKAKIEIKITGDDFQIDSDKSTSIALIINEIIQNSLDHAFIGRESGKIEIKIHRGNTYSTIFVIDDGIGFDINKQKKNSLGLNIVKSLVHDKLGGELNIFSNEEGTKVVFDFVN
ncbi:sensor histidine kinase [Hathewaya histolytica]|uniref:sensor histidine kinase n=1 Tax=Hathewaya histolytica TaxID=1498 RepID=UPI003B66CA1E